MKNILFLILIFVIKLSAYEYLLFFNPNPSTNTSEVEQFAVNDIDSLRIKIIQKNGNILYSGNYVRFINIYAAIKNSSVFYISNNDFQDIYKNDLNFLNDMYSSSNSLIPFLNYLYNDNTFSASNYIQYDNYELLYNSDGLVIESIVNGEWAGFYSDSEKSSSGYLYDSGGTLIYYNGEKVSWIQSAIDKVLQGVIGNLHTLIRLISTPVGVCVSVVFALCLVYYVVEVGRRSIKPFDGKVRKRFLGNKNYNE